MYYLECFHIKYSFSAIQYIKLSFANNFDKVDMLINYMQDRAGPLNFSSLPNLTYPQLPLQIECQSRVEHCHWDVP